MNFSYEAYEKNIELNTLFGEQFFFELENRTVEIM